ncbi:uncharacterized protein [Pyrus communis]|uniref:uncharacterized protein n=1 Tax=Pyrus communis TaxID=23211 RepID=UPI0035C1CEAC
MDYFSKWAEVVPLREVQKEIVVHFINEHINHRYGVPYYIITDNRKQFSNRLMDELSEKYKFKQHKSSIYHALANGLVKAFNKTLCNLLKKVIGRTKRDWHERMRETLWAYRMTYKTYTQAMHYSLVYGVVVLPLESQIPSLRMVIQKGLTEEKIQNYDFKSWKHSMKEGLKLNNTWNANKHGYPRHSTRRSAQGLSKLEILS